MIVCRVAYMAVLAALVPAAVAVAEGEAPRVLVAAEHSEFKDAVVERVSEHARNKGWTVQVLPLKALPQQGDETFDAVVVLNEIWAWRLRGSVRKYLKKASEEQRRRVILVSTAGNPDWRCKEEGVHAVTSASRTEQVEPVAAFVGEKLDSILKKDAVSAVDGCAKWRWTMPGRDDHADGHIQAHVTGRAQDARL